MGGVGVWAQGAQGRGPRGWAQAVLTRGPKGTPYWKGKHSTRVHGSGEDTYTSAGG